MGMVWVPRLPFSGVPLLGVPEKFPYMFFVPGLLRVKQPESYGGKWLDNGGNSNIFGILTPKIC